MTAPALPPVAFAQLDAFTTSRFGGNPAAVFQFPTADDPRLQDLELLANLAKETAQPMTAFLSPLEAGACTALFGNVGGIVVMCGHATLASAALLFAQNPAVDEITFNLTSGAALVATRLPNELVSLSLPADESVLLPLPTGGAGYEAAVAATVAAAPSLEGHILGAAQSQKGFVVELDEAVDLKGLVLDPTPFAPISTLFALAQATPSDPAFDIKSRVFAPAIGVPEDPVCGSAHCFIGPYFTGLAGPRSRLGQSFAPGGSSAESNLLRVHQVSPRGGQFLLDWDRAAGRMRMEGQAVLVSKGEWYI